MRNKIALVLILILSGCGRENLLPATPVASPENGNLLAPTDFDVTDCPAGTTLLRVKNWFAYSCYCYSPGGDDPTIACPQVTAPKW